MEYITEKRIETACQLLEETDMQVKEIVGQVGYINVSSFTKLFREKMGMPPLKYREDNEHEKRRDTYS